MRWATGGLGASRLPKARRATYPRPPTEPTLYLPAHLPYTSHPAHHTYLPRPAYPMPPAGLPYASQRTYPTPRLGYLPKNPPDRRPDT